MSHATPIVHDECGAPCVPITQNGIAVAKNVNSLVHRLVSPCNRHGRETYESEISGDFFIRKHLRLSSSPDAHVCAGQAFRDSRTPGKCAKKTQDLLSGPTRAMQACSAQRE